MQTPGQPRFSRRSKLANFFGLKRNLVILLIAIFVIEILARFAVQRAAFFRDGWNIFDMTVVGIALAPATAAFPSSGSSTPTTS